MAKMKDDELLSTLNSFEQDSTAYNSEYLTINESLLNRYENNPFGDEQEGRSKVVATDVSDLVDSDMTSLVRVFLGSGDVMIFEPNGDSDEEVEEAKQKTKYVNHIVRGRPGAYKLIHDWMKDAEIQKCGVIHYYHDTEKRARTSKYSKLNTIQISELMKSIKDNSEKVKKVEIVEQLEIKGDEISEPTFDVTIRIVEEIKSIKIMTIPTEDFIFSKNASSKWDANIVGHYSYTTRGELVAEGISVDKVEELPSISTDGNNSSSSGTNAYASGNGSTMKSIRWSSQGGDSVSVNADWASEQVQVANEYAKVDYDGDGIAERRFIRKAGNILLDNEAYDHVPYALLSGILDPHKAIGHSRAEIVMQDVVVNTALQRGIQDNIYMVNNPRNIVGGHVDLDDMMNVELGALVRVDEEAGANVANQVSTLETPFTADKALMVVQYRDSLKANRSGSMMASQGLDADALNQETATRRNSIDKAASAKIELVARNFAETGFRELYEGVAWLAAHYQDQDEEFRVLGKAMSVKPTDWQYPDQMTASQVGLGAGDGEQAVQNMSGILAIQQQLEQQGSMLTDPQKTYNALDKMVMGLGLARTDEFFNNPEIPEQAMFAQVQKLTGALQQAQMQIEQLTQKNPLAEAEMVKQQGAIATAQAKNQTELIKAQEQSRLKELELMQKGAQFQANLEKDYTNLELENNVDIEGVGRDTVNP